MADGEGLDTEVYVAIVALVISIIALSATVLQVLQQYFASATGYARCGKKVMGEWGTYTRRVPKPSELRFEVQFEAPVIFIAPPNNKNGPVPDEPIWVVDGSKDSYTETRTLRPAEDEDQRKQLSRKQLIHTADNERASWVELLAAVQQMEADSEEWQQQFYLKRSGNQKPAKFEERTLAVAVQRQTKSWDTMPSSVTKPYATTTMCHIVELAGVLGLHWKEFSRSADRYRAEGNGYILNGSLLRELGLVFTFQRTGKTIFEGSRVIPRDEVKAFCFGVVPTLFCTSADDELLKSPLDDTADMRVLHLGSSREIAESLIGLECNTNTLNCFLQESKKTTHLFPVAFEILGMLGRTIHASGSAFRMLPNPTTYLWDNRSFSMWKLLKAYQEKVRNAEDFTQKNRQIQDIDRDLERVLNAPGSRSGAEFPVPVMDALHDALDNADKYLTQVTKSVVLGILREHFQEVLGQINHASGDSPFDDLNKDTPERKQAAFMDLYFDIIRPEVVKSAPKRRSGTSFTSIAATLTPEKDEDKLPAMARGQYGFEGDERMNTIWCTLVFRMLCWLLLHDFHKKDFQVPKSELLGSRLPVYIV